jgi:integrase
MTLEELIREWLDVGSTGKREGSLALDRAAGRLLVRYLGTGKRVRDVTARDLDGFVAWRERQGRAPATIAREVATVRRLFRVAARWGYVTGDPAEGLRRPAVPEGRVVYLEVEEQRRLVAAAGEMDGRPAWVQAAPYMRPLVVVLLHCGLRIGEALNLRWDGVDLARLTLTVENAGGWRTKTGRVRVLGLSDDAVAALGEWREWFGRERARVAARLAGAVRASDETTARARLAALERCEPGAGRLVFPSWRAVDSGTGAAAPMDNVHKTWVAMTAAAGLEHATPHALRHTFAVSLARAGVPLTKIRAAMGHRSLRTTEIYLRFYPDEGRDVAARLPALGGSDAANVPQAEDGGAGECEGGASAARG